MLIAQMVDFTGVFVMLAVLAAGTIAGVVSIGVSLFIVRSRFGFTAAGIALILGIILLLVVLIVSRNGYRDIPWFYLVLAAPALLGAMGIGLTRLPAGRILERFSRR